MNEPRKHPDLFTDEEALEYLHVAGVGTNRTMERLRLEHRLPSFNIGKVSMYHRVHLDALVSRLAGIDGGQRSMKMSQG